MLGHKIRGQSFADRAEYPLIQPIEDKQHRHNQDVWRQRKTEVGNQEDDERGKEDVFLPNLSEREPAG